MVMQLLTVIIKPAEYFALSHSIMDKDQLIFDICLH